MEYILHGVNYQTLIMMLSDAPRFKSAKRGKNGMNSRIQAATAEDEASQIANFFRSNLKA